MTMGVLTTQTLLRKAFNIFDFGSKQNLADSIERALQGLEGSATFNPAELVDGVGETTTVTVTNAALGDFCVASFSLDLQGITVTSYVSTTDTVAVRFQNETTGTINLASGTLRARVWPQ